MAEGMEFLWKEYNLVYGIYEGYGGQLIELKGWSVTVGLAALLAAYSKPVSKNGRIAVLIAALSAIPFWLTETLWRQFQNANLSRLEKIEECAAGLVKGCSPLQSITFWQSEYQAEKYVGWFKVAFDPHVLMPHAFLFALGLLLFFKWPPRSET